VDRRAKQLFLTVAGCQLAEQIHSAVETIDQRIMEPFSAADMATISNYIRRLEDSLNHLASTN